MRTFLQLTTKTLALFFLCLAVAQDNGSASQLSLLVGLSVHEEQRDAFNEVVDDLVSTTDREAGALRYCFFLNENECRILATYLDDSALMDYLSGGGHAPLLNRLKAVSDQTRLDVIGDPGRAREKLLDMGASTFNRWKGFDRLRPADPFNVLLREGEKSRFMGEDINLVRLEITPLSVTSDSRVTLLTDFAIAGEKGDFGSVVDSLVNASKAENCTLQYSFSLSDDGVSCRMLETYANAGAAKAHFDTNKMLLQRMHNLSNITSVEVFGSPGLLVNTSILPPITEVFPYWKGFDKLITLTRPWL